MSFLNLLEESGIIQMLRNSLKTEMERKEFDAILEQKVKEYSTMYEDLNSKVMEYKSDVERINVAQSEHKQPKEPDNG